MMKRLYWPVEQCEQNYKGEEVGRVRTQTRTVV